MDTKFRGLPILFLDLLLQFPEFAFRSLQPLLDRLLLFNMVKVRLFQVSERTASYPESASTRETKNPSAHQTFPPAPPLPAQAQHLEALHCSLSSSACTIRWPVAALEHMDESKVGAGIDNITHLFALRSQRPKLSGALGTEPETASARLLEVSNRLAVKEEDRTDCVVLCSNLSIQFVVDTSQLFSSPSPDLFQFDLQIPLLRQLWSIFRHGPWFYHALQRLTRAL